MNTESIYDFLKIWPNTEFQLARHNGLLDVYVWVSPIGESDAKEIYAKYPALSSHYFVIAEGSQVNNLFKQWTVPYNSAVPSFGFYVGLEYKVIVKKQYNIGVGYSL